MKIKIQTNNKLPIADCRLPIKSGAAGNFNRQSKIGNRKAFTLVEMLLVVTIIGILAALVIPTHRWTRRTRAQSRPRRPTSTAASNPRSASMRWTMGFIRKACRI